MLHSFVSLVADASLSALSDRVHRGSLANARRALDERLVAEARTQALVRELEARAPARQLGLPAAG